MINKKRVNKVTKLTVASAIAFSALAQPLGTLVTVKAAEAPAATTKAENKLLQSTTSTESANQNLKSNLKASKPVIENPNFVFDTSTGTIPGWKVGIRNSLFYYGIYYQDYLRKDIPIVYTGSNSRYIVDNNTQFRLGAYSSGGIEISSDVSSNNWAYDVIYQTVKTVPGEEYTFSFPAIAKTGCSYDDHVEIGSNIVDDTTEGTITSTLEAVAVSNLDIPRDYSATFTASSTATRVEIVVARNRANGYDSSMWVKLAGGVSITPTDTTAPDAPTVTPVYDTDTNIKGSGEANCDVKVTLESGDIVTGRTDASGNFDITIPAQAAGKEIKVTLTDGAGNESNPTTVTVLATAIATPTIGAVTTDDTTVKGTGIKGATVTVTIGSQDYTATVDQSGNYSVTIPKQAVGTKITAKQTSSGKTSDSVSTTVSQGTIAPPTIGTVTTDDTTVKGTGIPGQRVYWKIGSADWYEYDYALVAADGTYVIYITPQQVDTQISVKHTVGGVDSALATTTVTQGTVAAPTISAVTSDDTTVKGTGIKGATVTVTIGSQDYTATVDQSGNYSVTISKQAVGTEITAKQTVNSKTSDSVSTTVTQGTVAAPTIGAVTTDDTTVKGTGIKGATVTVTIGGQDYTATVDQSGNYSVTISKQAFGTEITAKQTLNSQTSSDVTTTVTQGTVAPPTINPVTTDDQVVKGTGINGATVTVMIGSQEYTATVTNNEYSVAIPKQSSGTIISAKQTLNNKTSTIATTTVGQGTVAAPTINSLTTDDVVARGTGITGAVVTITIGSATYTGTVVNGNYAIEIPKQAVGTVVYAKQTLFNQTSSNAQTTVTQGSVSAPTINAVTTDSTTVTGTGINGATVTVKIGDQEYPATVANGTYSVTIPKQAFGTEITAKQSLGGKTSDAASTTVTQGTVSNPTINAVTSNDTTVTGSGITGATVTVSVGGQDYSGTVTNGAYSITIPKQAAGTEIKAKQSLNGKTSGSVSTIVTQGTLAAPTINDYTVGDGYVTGSAPAGATKVALYVGNQLIRYAAVTDGKYRVYAGDNAAMGVARTAFQVAGVDTAGTIGAKASSTVKASTTVAAPTINDFYARDAYAKGTATGASKVTLYVNNVAVRTATVAADGSYSIYTGDQASLATAGNTFQVQATNAAGKTSTKATATVKEKLAAPTINDFYAGDAYAKGIAAGASKVTLYVNNVAVRTAAVAADGSYSIYTGDQASLTTAGKTFQIQSTSAAGTTSTKTTGTVKAKTIVTAPTIKDYYVGDAYAKGIAAGASKVTLYVNNVAVRTAAVAADGSYSIYAGDQPSLATAGNTFQVQSTTASGVTSTKTTATVKEKVVAPTINDFYAGDAYAKGIATGASKVTLYVNNVAVRTAAVAANGTYSIYTGDQASLGTAGNTFQVQSTTASGTTSTKTTGTAKARIGAPTIADYYTTDVYAKGTAPTGATKVALYVQNVLVRYAPVTDGKYTIYTGDKSYLTTAGNTFQVAAVDAKGNIGTKATGTVKVDDRAVYKLTANDYNIATDETVTGTAGSSITRVQIEVDGVVKRQTTVGADGNYAIYAKDLITSTNNIVKIIGLDAQGVERNHATANVKNESSTAYQVTAGAYNIATDETVSGTAGSSITRVQIEVDGVIKRQTSVGADGKYAIYAKDVIKNTGNVVKIIGLDAQGNERNRATVTVKNETPATYNMTVAQYNTITDQYVTGTADAAITKVKIIVNNVDARSTATANGKYSIYASDKITSSTDAVQIVGYDANGKEVKRMTVPVVSVDPAARAITVADYTLRTPSITGTFGSDIKKIQLFVDGAFARQGAITGNAFEVYAQDKVTSATQVVQIVGFDASGVELARQTVTVK
ncbi:beta strand repeat-containing protein [Listeria booriae]|uniref:beta strand repeat-containing protein n=1 Tax=Listeria booriae TaxID=1552123 RepID=UPI00164CE149|nr:Ig-like domain-containing protein [Listeria booriae]MBC6152684.1 hypothetical protein [Listeria booriae]MBC6305370.1 hypothetical protein [Listeria booriae]